jgi:hypothetical protein
MVDDTTANAFFKKGGPLDWFSLTKTFVNAVKKNALTEKRCDLIDKVYAKHTRLKQASKLFVSASECRALAVALQHVQREMWRKRIRTRTSPPR